MTDADTSYECLPLPEVRDFIFAECGLEHRETVLGLLRESLGDSDDQLQVYREWRQLKHGDEYPGDHVADREFAAAERRPPSAIVATVREILDASAGAGVVGERFGEITEASSLVTDQANTHRLRNRFGDKVFAIGKQFYVYDGRKWVQDSSKPLQLATELSPIVKGEAQYWRQKFEAMAAMDPALKKLEATKRRDMSGLQDKLLSTSAGAEGVRALDMAESLERFAKDCESRVRQVNAVGIWRDSCQVDPARLDTARHLFNVMNCTLDLRFGEEGMQPRNPRDMITQLAPAYYHPGADCPTFKAFLEEIFPDAEMRAFLQRWYGYCLTGETREQKMVMHIGDGSEGKSTLNKLIEGIMGDYAAPASRGLITGSGGETRHSTETFHLKGKRLATATESNADQDVQEGFLKSMTGGDKITARALYENPSSFEPTHKLQLLTNHLPVVRGTDFAIWRRLLLVKYTTIFGSPEDVAAGKSHKIANTKLEDELLSERDGILTWLVEGAKEWYANGLQPPASVLIETQKYRTEQDRVGQYVKDRLTVLPEAWISYPDIYRDYQAWCFQSGYRPLGQGKLLTEVKRLVPSMELDRADGGRKQRTPDGKRRTVRGCHGVQLSTGAESAAERFPVVSTASDADADYQDLL